ncbi:MAG: hypothetical protein ACRDVE_11520, partial [Actinocrinis sp.]
ELHADLTSYTGRAGRRIVDAGEVELRVGASSADIRATLRLTMTGERREVGFDREMQPTVEFVEGADTAAVTAVDDGGAAVNGGAGPNGVPEARSSVAVPVSEA